MDDALYVAMAGASRSLEAQAVYSNNLANVNTAGFRADYANAKSVALLGLTYPSRVYSVEEESGTDFKQGPMKSTGRELDIALQGQGFIAVQAADGTEAYSRRGDLRIDPNGILTNGAGQPVLGNGGPISIPPAEKIEIGIDGTINIRPLGQGSEALATLDRIKLVNPDEADLVKGHDGLIRLQSGAEAEADAKVRVASGVMEGSNVNAVDSLINIINLSRNFEMQVKIMKELDQAGELTAQLLQMT